MHQVLLNPLADSSEKARGAIYTQREVVETILDLVGYSTELPLWEKSLLEPSSGQGDFLLPVIERLLTSYRRHIGSFFGAGVALKDSIRAVEIGTASHAMVCVKVAEFLETQGVSATDADELVQA